jgi:hypothetical protein
MKYYLYTHCCCLIVNAPMTASRTFEHSNLLVFVKQLTQLA